MNLTTETEHKAAVKEFRTLATDEAANHARLLVLRDAIHAYEEAHGHSPGLRWSRRDGQKKDVYFFCYGNQNQRSVARQTA